MKESLASMPQIPQPLPDQAERKGTPASTIRELPAEPDRDRETLPSYEDLLRMHKAALEEKQMIEERLRMEAEENARLKEKVRTLEERLARFEEQDRQLQEVLRKLRSLLDTSMEQNGEQRETIRHLEEEVHRLSFDEVTGLKIRTLFYRKLNNLSAQNISEAFRIDVAEWEDLDMEAFIDGIKSLDPERLEGVRLSVSLADGSGLGFANEAGHDVGDQLLKEIGGKGIETMKEFPDEAEAFRPGGDEFAIVSQSEKDRAEAIARRFQEKVGEIYFDYFASHGLENSEVRQDANLRVDIGTSHISEGFEAFQRFLAAVERHNGERFPFLPERAYARLSTYG
jgi:GGDEF domain-containing protein